MILYGICLSPSDLLHLVGEFLVPSILLQMHYFIPLRTECYSTVYMYHIFLIHSSVHGHELFPCLGYCEYCCSEHKGALSFSVNALSGYMTKSGIAGSYGMGSYGSSIFSFLR